MSDKRRRRSDPPMKKAAKQGKQLRETESEWEWLERYRVWDANRKIFLYPENWIEPELRLPTRFRASLSEVVAFIHANCGEAAKLKHAHRYSVCVLVTGDQLLSVVVADQTLAR